eukprot:Nk52_evm23s255 gene=Nk52_evmTU23s255
MLFKISSTVNISLLLLFCCCFLVCAKPCDSRGGCSQQHQLLPRPSSSSDSITPDDVWASFKSGFVADGVTVNCELYSSYHSELHGYENYLCNGNVCVSYTGGISYKVSAPGKEYAYKGAIIGPYCWFGCTATDDAPDDLDLASLLTNGIVSEDYILYITCDGTAIGTSQESLEIKLA